MKILHIIPSLDQGGAERLLVDLCDHASIEFEHIIVTLFGPIFFAPQRAAVCCIEFPRRLTFASLPKAIRSLLRLRSLIAAQRPDIVQGWLYYGNLLTVVLGRLAPRIVWSIHHTTFVSVPATRLARLAKWLCRLASGRVPDRIVYCAETARKLHESYGYCASKSVVIFNGISFAKFGPNEKWHRDTRARLGLAEDQLVVGHFARFDQQKNFRLVCEAIALAKPKLGPFNLLLAGRGTETSNIELGTLLSESGLERETIRLGMVDDAQLYLNAVDIVVLGSSYGEALPMVLIEAAACERAIVATRVGDIPMLGLSPESIVPPDDPEDFALALIREAAAWRDGSGAKDRAAVAAHVRDELSIEGCGKAYEALYLDLARAAQRAAQPSAQATPG